MKLKRKRESTVCEKCKKESHQPCGLRWFRFKTLPIFQLGGFTLPPTPFPGLCFEGFAVPQLHFIRCSFPVPFFSPLGTPQNRYHKLFRRQNVSVLGLKRGPKQPPTSELTFSLLFVDFVIFSIPPQVPPVKRLLYPNHIFVSLAFFSFSCLLVLVSKTFRAQNNIQNGSQNGARNWTP